MLVQNEIGKCQTDKPNNQPKHIKHVQNIQTHTYVSTIYMCLYVHRANEFHFNFVHQLNILSFNLG